MTIEELELKADTIRQDIIKMLEQAGSGHSAGFTRFNRHLHCPLL